MSIWQRIKPWLKGWRLVGLIVVVLIVGSIVRGIYNAKHNTSNIMTDTVKRQNLTQTVLATGDVTSSTDLDLGFKNSGTVQNVNVNVGAQVTKDQVLATLDQKDQLATLTSAQGALAAATANYDKVVAGSSSEDIAVAQAAVNSAQSALTTTQAQQQVLVNNAFSALLNAGLAAIPSSTNSTTATATISGTYASSQQGQYEISLSQTGGGLNINYQGLETGTTPFTDGIPIALGNRGLFITFSASGTFSSVDTWTVPVPNTQASTYLTAYNAYQSALQTQASATAAAQSALDQAQANLALKKAQARPADIEAAKAQILSAQGQVQAANAALENTIIRAPSSGTVTKVDVKVGQTTAALSEALVLENIDQLHLEADISEANVAQIQTGQMIDVTFDAIGPDKHYNATVTNLDLSSTVVSGVVNYKLTASLDKADEIKPGMTANMTIHTGEKDGVLAIPSRAIVLNGETQYVRVITNDKTKAYSQQPIQTGFQADGGLVEVTSGLSEGQEIVTFIK
jgi:HlyD family secretion protein